MARFEVFADAAEEAEEEAVQLQDKPTTTTLATTNEDQANTTMTITTQSTTTQVTLTTPAIVNIDISADKVKDEQLSKSQVVVASANDENFKSTSSHLATPPKEAEKLAAGDATVIDHATIVKPELDGKENNLDNSIDNKKEKMVMITEGPQGKEGDKLDKPRRSNGDSALQEKNEKVVTITSINATSSSTSMKRKSKNAASTLPSPTRFKDLKELDSFPATPIPIANHARCASICRKSGDKENCPFDESCFNRTPLADITALILDAEKQVLEVTSELIRSISAPNGATSFNAITEIATKIAAPPARKALFVKEIAKKPSTSSNPKSKTKKTALMRL